MKFKSLFLAALLVVSSAVSFAGKDEPRKTGLAVVPVKGSEIFKVVYRGENAGKVKLTIYNNAGTTVYSETINGLDGFIYPINFKGLTSGEYTIEIQDAAGKKVEKVVYQAFKKSNNFHVSKLSDDGKFLVTVANKESNVINIRILDKDNNVIHSESKAIEGDFARVYKLTTMTGGCTFEFSDKSGNSQRLFF
jgi:hypothetical protein